MSFRSVRGLPDPVLSGGHPDFRAVLPDPESGRDRVRREPSVRAPFVLYGDACHSDAAVLATEAFHLLIFVPDRGVVRVFEKDLR